MNTFLIIINSICVIVFGWFSYQSFLKLKNPKFDKTTNRLNLIFNLFVCVLNLIAVILTIL
jgi:hypothetical protein